MIVARALPTLLQSVLFVALLGVDVDPVLLCAYAAVPLLGGLSGARLMARAPISSKASKVTGAPVTITEAHSPNEAKPTERIWRF